MNRRSGLKSWSLCSSSHARKNCRDLKGQKPWACGECDCTKQLEQRLAQKGDAFVQLLTRHDETQIVRFAHQAAKLKGERRELACVWCSICSRGYLSSVISSSRLPMAATAAMPAAPAHTP